MDEKKMGRTILNIICSVMAGAMVGAAVFSNFRMIDTIDDNFALHDDKFNILNDRVTDIENFVENL